MKRISLNLDDRYNEFRVISVIFVASTDYNHRGDLDTILKEAFSNVQDLLMDSYGGLGKSIKFFPDKDIVISRENPCSAYLRCVMIYHSSIKKEFISKMKKIAEEQEWQFKH